MRVTATVFAAIVLIAGPAHAESDKVQRAPVPAWVEPSELMSVPEDASGSVFVRSHDSLVHLDRRGQAHYQNYRLKILHPSALQLGNISLAWNPDSGAPAVHSVKVHRGQQVIDVLESASFEILRREDQLEAAVLDGVLTAILRVPDLRVGDELEVSWTIRSDDPTLGADDAGFLALAADPAPGRFRLGLSWEEGQEPRLKMTADMLDAAERRNRGVTFSFDNPVISTPPKHAPARYAWQRVVEYSDFPEWAAISRHLAPLFHRAARIEEGSPLKKEVDRIKAAHQTPLDRASAALKLVQQDVRYIYVGLNGGNLTPATAEDTWKRRYGDCKGKTALLLGLLGELGIDAEAVAVSNTGVDDGLDERLPSARLFDHVLVRARIDGSHYWLDGSLPSVAVPSHAPVLPYRWVLPLTTRGSSIESLEWRPAKEPDTITLFEIDARAGFDHPARITSTNIVRGIKGLQQHVQFSALAPSQLLSVLRQELVGDIWQTIDDARWRYDAAARASVLTVSGTGQVNWDDDGDGAKSLTLPGGGFNPPERRVRPADQNQALPYYNAPEFDCRATTVRLPKSTQPSHWSYNSTFDTQLFGRRYYRAFELRDGAIRMIRGSRVEQREIDTATAAQDNAKIASFDNSMAVISYVPSGSMPNARGSATVPATYEIDWTARDVPCLTALKAD